MVAMRRGIALAQRLLQGGLGVCVVRGPTNLRVAVRGSSRPNAVLLGGDAGIDAIGVASNAMCHSKHETRTNTLPVACVHNGLKASFVLLLRDRPLAKRRQPCAPLATLCAAAMVKESRFSLSLALHCSA